MTPGPSGRPCRPVTSTALGTSSSWAISLGRRLCLVLFYLDTQPCKPQPRTVPQNSSATQKNANQQNQSLELDPGPPVQHAEHQDLRRSIIYKIGSSLVYSQHPSRCLVCVCCMAMKERILIGPLDLHIITSSYLHINGTNKKKMEDLQAKGTSKAFKVKAAFEFQCPSEVCRTVEGDKSLDPIPG